MEQGPARTLDKSDWVPAISEVLDLSLLPSVSVGALLATSSQLRKYVRENITRLTVADRMDTVLLARRVWPRLSKLVVRHQHRSDIEASLMAVQSLCKLPGKVPDMLYKSFTSAALI